LKEFMITFCFIIYTSPFERKKYLLLHSENAYFVVLILENGKNTRKLNLETEKENKTRNKSGLLVLAADT